MEDELQSIIEGQEQSRESLREKGRQKIEAGSAKEEEYRGLLEDLDGESLPFLEEITTTGAEGSNITKPKARIDRAEALYKEGQASLEKRDFGTIKPRITAARTMVENAKQALSEAQVPK